MTPVANGLAVSEYTFGRWRNGINRVLKGMGTLIVGKGHAILARLNSAKFRRGCDVVWDGNRDAGRKHGRGQFGF